MELWSKYGIATGGSVLPGYALELYNLGGPGSANYESLRLAWESNRALIFSRADGTGTPRTLRLGHSSVAGATAPNRWLDIAAAGATLTMSVGSGAQFEITNSSQLTAASGTQQALAISSTIAQSGTAGYTALDVNPTESSTGSGTRLLQRWAVGGTAQAQLSAGGVFAALNNIGVGSVSLAINSTLESFASFAAGIGVSSTNVTLGGGSFTRLIDATSGAVTVTLPAALGCTRRIYNIKKIDASANTVTIDANAAETIDGALTQVLTAQWQSITIQSDGTNWYII